MKRIFSVLLVVATLTTGAQGKVVTDSLSATMLGVSQKFNVYLPRDYDASKHYPVIYLLHGLWGCYEDWVNTGQMDRVADQLIASGECVPVVIIMPNAGTSDVHHYQCGYFNVEGWPFEDYFFKEFLPMVEKKYNCGGAKGLRAVMGLSMGGGGTVVYAQRHPDMFSSAYGMSAWLDLKDHAAREYPTPDSKLALTDRSVAEHSAPDFVANADKATVEALKSVKWFLDCGDDDFLLTQTMSLYRQMQLAGIKAELRVRDGAHTWEYWHTALHTALPFASRNFDR